MVKKKKHNKKHKSPTSPLLKIFNFQSILMNFIQKMISDTTSPLIQYKNGQVRYIDWSPIRPNIVNNDTLYIFAIQDLVNNDSPSRLILLNSSRHFQFHVNLIGLGAERYNEWGFALKLLWQYRASHAPFFNDSDYLLFLDAWDAHFTTNVTEVMSSYHHYYGNYDIVLSADPDIFPEKNLRPCFEPHVDRTYPFANSGFILGKVSAFKQIFNSTAPYWGQKSDDQLFWNLVFANYNLQNTDSEKNYQSSYHLKKCKNFLEDFRPLDIVEGKLPKMVIDSKCILSSSMSHVYHHMSNQGSRIVNLFTGTYPTFVHYNWIYERKIQYDYPLFMSTIYNPNLLSPSKYLSAPPNESHSEYFVIKNKMTGKYVWDNIDYLAIERVDDKIQYKDTHTSLLYPNSTYLNESSIFKFTRIYPNEDRVYIQSVKNLRYVGQIRLQKGVYRLDCNDWGKEWDMKSLSWSLEYSGSGGWWKVREVSKKEDIRKDEKRRRTGKKLWSVEGGSGEASIIRAGGIVGNEKEDKYFWRFESIPFDLKSYSWKDLKDHEL